MLTVHLSFLFQVSQCYTTTINFSTPPRHIPLYTPRGNKWVFLASNLYFLWIRFNAFLLSFSLSNFPSIDRSRSARRSKKKKKKKRNNGKRGGNEKWRFSRKVGGKSRRTGQRRLHRSSPKGNPLARLKKSLDSSYHHRAGILMARSIIGGEGRPGRQSKRFVTAAEERVRCSIGRRRTGLTATMFDLSAAFSRWK